MVDAVAGRWSMGGECCGWEEGCTNSKNRTRLTSEFPFLLLLLQIHHEQAGALGHYNYFTFVNPLDVISC